MDWYDVIFDDNVLMSNLYLFIFDGGLRIDYSIGVGVFNQDGFVGGELDKFNYECCNVCGIINIDLIEKLQFSVFVDYMQIICNFLVENSGGIGIVLMNYIIVIFFIYFVWVENGELFNMGR